MKDFHEVENIYLNNNPIDMSDESMAVALKEKIVLTKVTKN